MSYKKLFIMLVASVFMMAANAESQILIDNFSDGIFLERNSVGIVTQSIDDSDALPDRNILGGERDEILNCTQKSGTFGVRISGTSGKFSFDASSGAIGIVTLIFDGDEVLGHDPSVINPTGLGGVQLDDGVATVIGFDVTEYDDEFDMTIDVYSNSSDWSRWTGTVKGLGYFEAPFAAFVKGSGATNPANFTSVGAIVVTLDAKTARNAFSFNFVASYNPDPPNLIELVSFTSISDSDSVTLNWETASETDNAGFHIWRSASEDGEYVRITDAMIPANGNSVTGAVYTFEDLGSGGDDYFYKLEDIDYNGVSTFHALTARYRSLASGWNILAGDAFAGMAVSEALASIDGKYSSVWVLTESGWQMYTPGQAAFSDLETFEAGNDYWIYATEGCNLLLP